MWKGLRTVGLSMKKNKGFEHMMSMMSESVTLLNTKNEILTNKDDNKGTLRPKIWDAYFPSPFTSLRHMPGSNIMDVTYPSGTKDFLKIVKGKRLEEDVVSLLSNGGKRDYLVRNNGAKVPVESITGKYLLICCFKVPLPSRSTSAQMCRTMIATYSNLLQNNNFEMVMVAKTTCDPYMAAYGGEEAAFNRFFAAFPCLAIPFWDTESRDFVSESLGLTKPSQHNAALVLDPNQMVLQTDGRCFYDYGTSAFPFSDDHLAFLKREEEEMRRRLEEFEMDGGQLISSPGPVSLEELLGGDVLLSRFGDGHKMSVSDLRKNKCVVLYLCRDGDFISQLYNFHQRCVEYENLDVEIVVVQMAFLSDTTTSYVKSLQRTLERGCCVSTTRSWWVLPLGDGEAARRLWRISYQNWFGMDLAIILADGGNAVELTGREYIEWVVSENLAFHYPFTGKSMLDKMFSRLRSITLDSLLGVEGYPLISSDPTTRVAVSELKGRNVLLYLDYYDAILKGSSALCKLVLGSYKKMQEDYPDSEVVFVPLDDEVPAVTPVLPWLALPHPAAKIQGELLERMNLSGDWMKPALFAFGDDGLVHSLLARHHLQDNVNGVSLFADNLFQEVFENMSYRYEAGV